MVVCLLPEYCNGYLHNYDWDQSNEWSTEAINLVGISLGASNSDQTDREWFWAKGELVSKNATQF